MINTDNTTTIRKLQDKIINFRNARGWEENTAKDLAISIVLEAAELLEHFQWGHYEKKEVRENKEKIKDLSYELADVIIYLLAFADDLGIEITPAVIEKLAWNEKKYPVSRFNPHHQDHEFYYQIKKDYRNKEKQKETNK